MEPESFLPLSARELHILLALAAESLNGYQIALAVEENSDGRLRLSPATQYTNLHRMVDRGLVHEVTEEESERADGRGQRYWSLTPLGQRVLKAEARRLEADLRRVRALKLGD